MMDLSLRCERTAPRSWALAALLLLLGYGRPVLAQEYVERGQDRFSFAQLYLGVEAAFMPTTARTSYFDATGARRDYTAPPGLEPRLTLGGYHFWGHADFYVSFQAGPILRLGSDNDAAAPRFEHGVDTGARLLPWRLAHGKLRPFLGLALSAGQYSQAATDRRQSMSGFQVNRLQTSLGLAYSQSWGVLTLEAQSAVLNRVRVPVSAGDKVDATTAPLTFSLGYRFVLETTRISQRHRDAQLAGAPRREAAYSQWGESNRLGGVFVAAGLSSAWTLSTFSFDDPRPAFLVDRMHGGSLVPDLAFGYTFPRLEAELRASYRFIAQDQRVLTLEQRVVRHVTALEATKALFDFHGFVPFAGLAFDVNFVKYREQYGDTERTSRATLPWFNLICGWDIRPSKATPWLLRTNLRYNPGLRPELTGVTGHTVVPVDQLEFNFIQLVWYPS